MKSRLLFYLILGIVLGACEHLEMPSNEDVSPQKESKALLSVIKVADDFMGQLDGGTRAPRILSDKFISEIAWYMVLLDREGGES